jgi:peptidoglycan/xylan/chitin deacetylase (PgdA/CDA1 family)
MIVPAMTQTLRKTALLLLLLIPTLSVDAGESTSYRAVAITIDDLPRGGDGGPRDLASLQAMTAKLLKPFADQQIPVIGFVNAGRYENDEPGLRKILNQWLDAGAQLGNHSYSHPDINNTPLAKYTADITRGEVPLKSLLAARGQKLTYYRHPFLHVGSTPEDKQGLAQFLAKQGYTEAPVTFDNADYAWAASYLRPEDRDRAAAGYVPYMESVVAFFEQRAVEVMGREFPQILLIHANQLNADQMPQLLAMFRSRGYRFVTLEEALRDPVYQTPENYVGRNGFSWLHRWSRAKGMPNKGEPDAPDWVMKGF